MRCLLFNLAFDEFATGVNSLATSISVRISSCVGFPLPAHRIRPTPSNKNTYPVQVL